MRLDEIASNGLTRHLGEPAGIDLSSNDYLGLAADWRLVEAMTAGVEKYGVGSTGSRLLRGHRDCFCEAEQAFADWKGTERAVLFGSGYHANIGVLTTFAHNADIVFSDELNHASLIDGIRLSKARRVIYKHRDIDGLAQRLREYKTAAQKFLVTESLFSMEGDIAPLDKYAEICRETNTALIVDEAHAVGLFGYEGSGLIDEFGVGNDVFLSVNTAGKALGVAGAFAAGAGWAMEYLIQKARPFIFSTAQPPAIPAALLASINIVRNDGHLRGRLFKLTRFFRQLLGSHGISAGCDLLEQHSPIVPIHIGDNERAYRVAAQMQNLGFDVRAIRPPTVPEGTARLRVSLNISLNEEILRVFARTLKNVIERQISCAA